MSALGEYTQPQPSSAQALPLKMQWRSAVLAGIHRLVDRSGNAVFTRQQLIENELDEIVHQTQSVGKTPASTLDRVHQGLVREGKIERIVYGVFRLLPPPPPPPPAVAVAIVAPSSDTDANNDVGVTIVQSRKKAILSTMAKCVLLAMQRQVIKHNSDIIYKDQMICEELETMIREAHCRSAKPKTVVASALRDLCKLEMIEKLQNGKAYRILIKAE